MKAVQQLCNNTEITGRHHLEESHAYGEIWESAWLCGFVISVVLCWSKCVSLEVFALFMLDVLSLSRINGGCVSAAERRDHRLALSLPRSHSRSGSLLSFNSFLTVT